MTWSELEAWAKRNGMHSPFVYEGAGCWHGEFGLHGHPAYKQRLLVTGRASQASAKRALCAAVVALREAK